MTYKIYSNNPHTIVLDDVKFVPIADSNKDYQQYLAWVSAGNVPEYITREDEPEVPPTKQIFDLPVYAPDFIVQSPKPKTDPLQALTEAIEEAAKADKSVALIVLDLVKYLEDVEKRLKKAKV